MSKGFSIKAYIDLTRAHFFFVWPILFLSGLALAYQNYGGFSWELTVTAALIGLFGFEAGLVLNDYVDRDLDKKDLETDKLTRYWRLFGKRPIAVGQITPQDALMLFYLLAFITVLLIIRLPYPNSLYVFLIMLYSYSVEYFYQIKKRDQRFPWAQLLGRTDFALFPAAGYLCLGQPDTTALSYFLFFYPLSLVHLGVNDLADYKNDQARGLKTVTVLYGLKGTVYWIMFFTALHYITAPLLMAHLAALSLIGFALSFLLLIAANYVLIRKPNPARALKVLPLVHAAMLVYAVSIIIGI